MRLLTHLVTSVGLWALCLAAASNFSYDSRNFLLDGQPFQIIGGQMDPQRIPPSYWRQRLKMARAMGLNTVFSYLFWNNLEPSPGTFDFSGRNDVARFFHLAQEEGLAVVLRPGPYVCGEHEWGGFPAWLSEVPGMRVRENNGPFLEASGRYLDRLGEELRPLQVNQGGPILMVQLENEYGSFGDDKAYLRASAAQLRRNFDVFLYTTDGGAEPYLRGGQLPGVLAETDGDPRAGFAARDSFVTDRTSLGPQLDGEYYVTWFDDWSSASAHHSAPEYGAKMVRAIIDDLEWVLKGNNSFNIYMFHGGTNWGFESGSVWSGDHSMAVTSSYDYGAPLDEAGRPTELYFRLRDMILRHVPAGSVPEVPEVPELTGIAEFALRPSLNLFDTLYSQPGRQSASPVTMESLGQSHGFVAYEHRVTAAVEGVLTAGDEPRDRIAVYVNGRRVGLSDRRHAKPAPVRVSLKKGDRLQLLVENMGRVDFTRKLMDQRKGIVGNVTVGGNHVLSGWLSVSLPLTEPPAGLGSGYEVDVRDRQPPVFYTGSFSLPAGVDSDLGADTFLEIRGGVKGQVWVNGVNLGRYWAVGPQQSLYLPGCHLKTGGRPNEVVVLELEPRRGGRLSAMGLASRKWFNAPDPDSI